MKTEKIIYGGKTLTVPIECLPELYEACRQGDKPFWFYGARSCGAYIIAGYQQKLVVGMQKSTTVYHFVPVGVGVIEGIRTARIVLKFHCANFVGFFENGMRYSGEDVLVRGRVHNPREEGEKIKWLKL